MLEKNAFKFFFSEKICTFAKIFLLSFLLKDYFFN